MRIQPVCAITVAPDATPERRPEDESSNTTQCGISSALSPSRLAASRYGAGSGLCATGSSPHTYPANSPSDWRMTFSTIGRGEVDTSIDGTPASFNECSTPSTPSIHGRPFNSDS